jgi:hypothetical protein
LASAVFHVSTAALGVSPLFGRVWSSTSCRRLALDCCCGNSFRHGLGVLRCQVAAALDARLVSLTAFMPALLGRGWSSALRRRPVTIF